MTTQSLFWRSVVSGLAGVLMLAAAIPLAAQAGSISVMAVVNGKPITNLDFEQRRNFLIKTTGIEDSPESSEQIDKDVLQMLIDDIIKYEEGVRLGRGMEVAARNRAKEIVDLSFSQHGEDPNIVMERLGIERPFAEQKFLTDVLWASTVQSRFAQDFAQSAEEAEVELERIKANAMKPQINLDEIVLVPEPSRNFSETMTVARQMVAAIRKGADFGRIAQQFSVSGSSQQGGNVGWVVLERLPENIRKTVENLPSGSVANPAEIDGAIVIYRVNGIRVNGNADPLEAEVTVGRLVLPVEKSDRTSRETAATKVVLDSQEVKTCPDLKAIHERYASGLDFNFGVFKLRDFSPQLRKLLLPLDRHEMTGPINYSEGMVIFMVCDKITPELDLPSLDEIEQKIRNKHFSVLSARYLSQLRRKAIIDYKDSN